MGRWVYARALDDGGPLKWENCTEQIDRNDKFCQELFNDHEELVKKLRELVNEYTDWSAENDE